MLFCFIVCVLVPNCVIIVLSLHYHSQSHLVVWLSFLVLSSPVVVVSCLMVAVLSCGCSCLVLCFVYVVLWWSCGCSILSCGCHVLRS